MHYWLTSRASGAIKSLFVGLKSAQEGLCSLFLNTSRYFKHSSRTECRMVRPMPKSNPTNKAILGNAPGFLSQKGHFGKSAHGRLLSISRRACRAARIYVDAPVWYVSAYARARVLRSGKTVFCLEPRDDNVQIPFECFLVEQCGKPLCVFGQVIEIRLSAITFCELESG